MKASGFFNKKNPKTKTQEEIQQTLKKRNNL